MITVKQAYKKFLEKNKLKGFLCSAFVMCDPKEIENAFWQLDFYNKKTDTIDSYLIKDNIIETINTEAKPFKEKDQKVNELNLDNVKITYKQALEIANKENKEDVSRVIILLQNQDKEIWNISFFTKSFNLINIKIDAKNNKIIEKTTEPLIKF